MTIMDEIEYRTANNNLGTIAWQIYVGARGEGASRIGAFIVLSAWFFASMELALEVEAERIMGDEEEN